jgi:hypothetical protein
VVVQGSPDLARSAVSTLNRLPSDVLKTDRSIGDQSDRSQYSERDEQIKLDVKKQVLIGQADSSLNDIRDRTERYEKLRILSVQLKRKAKEIRYEVNHVYEKFLDAQLKMTNFLASQGSFDEK